MTSSTEGAEQMAAMATTTDPDVDPVFGLRRGSAAADDTSSNEGAECLVAAMASADPDIDPVFGLLCGCVATDAGETHQGPPLDCLLEASNASSSQSTAVSGFTPESPSREAVDVEPEELEHDTVTARDLHFISVAAEDQKPISAVVDKKEVAHDRFVIPADIPMPIVSRRNIEGCDAFVLDGVLSSEECTSLVKQADGLWSFWDSSATPRVSFRNASTIEVTHQELADRIWSRVGNLVTPCVSISEEDERFEVDIQGDWKPYAMNPKLLLSRYLHGGHFSPHTDGTTVVDFNRRTFYSCVLFLNASPWGGHTCLYANSQIGRELQQDGEGRLTGDPELVLEAVPPAPGRMLVFYHRLMHEGVPAAEKYIIRTDVLYRREPEMCTAPEDIQAFDMYQEAQLLAERGDCQAAAALFRRAFRRSPALCRVYRC